MAMVVIAPVSLSHKLAVGVSLLSAGCVFREEELAGVFG